jgi:hypothetical protein
MNTRLENCRCSVRFRSANTKNVEWQAYTLCHSISAWYQSFMIHCQKNEILGMYLPSQSNKPRLKTDISLDNVTCSVAKIKWYWLFPVRFQVLMAASMKLRVFWYTAVFLIGCRLTFQRCVQGNELLMMEAARTSETSFDIHLRTWQYIPEDWASDIFLNN